jgi:hypothetical protein
MSDEKTIPEQSPVESFAPWQGQGLSKLSQACDKEQFFAAHYKRHYLILIIIFFAGLVWLGASIFNKDTTEIFIVAAIAAGATLISNWASRLFLPFLVVVFLSVFLMVVAGFGQILGQITIVVIFFIMFPIVILSFLIALFDNRPQLIISAGGMTCRQFGESEIPWKHIRHIHVSTYQRYSWMPKQKSLMISLYDPFMYPTSENASAPRKLSNALGTIVTKLSGNTDIRIAGWLLDPELPFVMKAIKRYRPDRKPKVGQRRKKSSRMRKQTKG